jgi:5'-3' exonuclease
MQRRNGGVRHISIQGVPVCSLSGLAMGKEITSEAKESWDSNAITPGTPFMDLLANSLRYWVVQKLNTDPGWKDVRFVYSVLCPPPD